MSKQGKYIALVLRHSPEVAGLTLDNGGWAKIKPLLEAISSKYGSFSRRDLEALVAEDDKGRYSIRGDLIRANQGHSVKVDLGLSPVTPPATLFHGTKQKWVGSILTEGLNKGKRQHVHLSSNLDTAANVADRRSGDSVIFVVDCVMMLAAGHDFYLSENGVWLTDHVPPTFLRLHFEQE